LDHIRCGPLLCNAHDRYPIPSDRRCKAIMERTKIQKQKVLTSAAERWPLVLGITLAMAGSAQAQGTSPWENAVTVLQTAFTGPIAKGLALVAIVIGGLTFAFGEGGGKRTFAGIVFGLGMAVLSANFLTWLFGV
jgi:type IV secretion system protein TrbC